MSEAWRSLRAPEGSRRVAYLSAQPAHPSQVRLQSAAAPGHPAPSKKTTPNESSQSHMSKKNNKGTKRNAHKFTLEREWRRGGASLCGCMHV